MAKDLLESLIAQRKACGGDRCVKPKCKRCRRGREREKRGD